MGTTAAFDDFVEKVVIHNKLVTKQQLDTARGFQTQNAGVSLLDVLIHTNLVRKEHAAQIQAAFQKQAAPQPQPASRPATAPPIPATSQTGGRMDVLLNAARKIGASDLHVITGSAPLIRKDGVLVELEPEKLSVADCESLLMSILNNDQKELLRVNRALDTAITNSAGGILMRYRMCVVHQKNGYDGSFRLINPTLASPKVLGLPENVMVQLTDYHQGLVLVTGPSGCGKSTTVAAMLEMVNQKRDCHIITLEDPIENIFTPVKAHFSQRQLGEHTASFSAALRAALREDPDVIMIGELRDHETASLAVTAAETGHLVISTLHTTNAMRTITRLLDMFPADQKPQVQAMISESLRGIIAQKLVPLKEGAGRVLATEILINTQAIGSMVRKGQFIQIPSAIQTGGAQGMRGMDTSVNELLKAGLISGTEAFFAADNQPNFQAHAPKDE